jgi:hypothetical protein
MMGAGIANGLYCIAGLTMSVESWRDGQLRGSLGVFGFLMWTVGLGLSVATFVDHRQAMVLTGGAVIALFVPWAAMTGWKFRTADGRNRSGRVNWRCR